MRNTWNSIEIANKLYAATIIGYSGIIMTQPVPPSMIAQHFCNNQFKQCIAVYETHPSDGSVQEQFLVAIAYAFCKAMGDSLRILNRIKKHAAICPHFYTYLGLVHLHNGQLSRARYAIQKESDCSTTLYIETALEIAIKSNHVSRIQTLLPLANNQGLHTLSTVGYAYIDIHHKRFHDATSRLTALYDTTPNSPLLVDAIFHLIRNANRINTHLLEMAHTCYQNGLTNFDHIDTLLFAYYKNGNTRMATPLHHILRLWSPDHYTLMTLFLTPAVYESLDQIMDYRARIRHTLNNLSAATPPDLCLCNLTISVPFYLAYHSEDNRPLLEAAAAVYAPLAKPVPPMTRPRRRKRKIAIICDFLYKNSVTDFYETTIQNLPEDYDVTLVSHTNIQRDAVTKALNKRAQSVYHYSSISRLFDHCVRHAYDMIIYPEVGMSYIVYTLAMHRLAPIQVALIGHPETTGLSTVDYYISWSHFHHYPGQDQFTETLVTLANLPMGYRLPEYARSLPDNPTKDPSKTLFFVPMAAFKMHPDFDPVIVALIQDNPNNHVILIRYPGSDVTARRLAAQLSASEYKRVQFIPFVSFNDYLKLLAMADVVLETFPFGGGNTTLHCLAMGVPYITLQGRFLRGSFGAGYYRYMNHTSFIAETPDQYIELALMVAKNPHYVTEFRKQMMAHRDLFFDNMAGPHEFYDWMREKML
jgi:predicted O-linked N-acetylglucosamine transferase (SPINDLY family)